MLRMLQMPPDTYFCRVQVTRGTIQAVLKHRAFDEARRLGLQPDTEALLRKEFPKETGVLTVEEVVPKGPADDVLEPGDVVVRMVRATSTVIDRTDVSFSGGRFVCFFFFFCRLQVHSLL